MSLILVVDDQESVREVLKKILEGADCEVVLARDGEEGLHAVKNFAPDAVILDVKMPHMDGLTMLKHLRQGNKTADLPVILISDAVRPSEKKIAMELGVVDYLSKPVDADVIELRVKWALKAGSVVPAVPWDLAGSEPAARADSHRSGGQRPQEKAGPVSTASDGEVSTEVTPGEGGSVQTADGGLSVEVPPDAVPDTVGMHLRNGDQTVGTDDGALKVRLGKRSAEVRISDTSGTQISGMKLQAPARVGIMFDEEDAPGPGEQRLLRLQEFDPNTGEWFDLATYVDPGRRVAYSDKTRLGPAPVALEDWILIVEQDEREFGKIQTAIEGLGFMVEREVVPARVRGRIRDGRPAMLILGEGVAGSIGTRIMRAVKKDPDIRTTTIIAIESAGDLDAYSDALTLGVRDVLSGPVQMGDLQYRVKHAYAALIAKRRRRTRRGAEAPAKSASGPRVRRGRPESGVRRERGPAQGTRVAG